MQCAGCWQVRVEGRVSLLLRARGGRETERRNLIERCVHPGSLLPNHHHPPSPPSLPSPPLHPSLRLSPHPAFLPLIPPAHPRKHLPTYPPTQLLSPCHADVRRFLTTPLGPSSPSRTVSPFQLQSELGAFRCGAHVLGIALWVGSGQLVSWVIRWCKVGGLGLGWGYGLQGCGFSG